MFSAKQGHYWNPGPPTLEASTISLGYRGGGRNTSYAVIYTLLYNATPF